MAPPLAANAGIRKGDGMTLSGSFLRVYVCAYVFD